MMTTTSASAERAGRVAAPGLSASTVDVGLLVLRIVPFGLLAVQGARKLFGAFGGSGFAATAESFGQMGYQPAEFFALLGGGSELVGGLLLAFGLLTPLGSAMALGVMINAVVAVADKGLDTVSSPIVLGIVAVALAFSGPGRYSLDAGRPWQRTGLVWAGASIGLAMITAVGSQLAKG
jgi:putative oxidoreductase